MKKLGIKRAVEFIKMKTAIENETTEPELKHTPLSYFSQISENLLELLKETFSKKEELELTFTLTELQMNLALSEIEDMIQACPTLQSLNERGLIVLEVKIRLECLYIQLSFKPDLSFSEVMIKCKPQCYVLSFGFEDYHLMLSDKIKGEREFITQAGLNRKGFIRFFKEVEKYIITVQEDTRFA